LNHGFVKIPDGFCRYPSLRVAYIDEVEERVKEKAHKVYYSILVKAVNGLDQVNDLLQMCYNL